MQSREVSSNQTDIHPDLESRIVRHRQHPYQKPSADSSRRVFSQLQQLVSANQRPLILDSGCGTGQSSIRLANRFPDHLVIGVDKSAHRLRHQLQAQETLSKGNLILARIDLIDLWRLAAQHEWRLTRHYLFYPNPWPKKKHLQRRWYAHPVFPSLLALGGRLQLRTNWSIFHHEFALAMQLMGYPEVQQSQLDNPDPVSPFEKKYKHSGHRLFRSVVDLQ
jgi:tRNA G46 methylase TrmB